MNPASHPLNHRFVGFLTALGENTYLSAIRAGMVSFPRGRTVFEKGDRVFALTRRAAEGELRAALLGDAR